MRHAESLFLVNDEQAQILKLHIARKQAMGSDDDIHPARFEFRQGLLLLHRSTKTAQHFDSNRKRRESPAKCVVMLEREHRRRRKHCHLPRVRYNFERRAHRNFRLTVTDVAAKQPLHRLARFEIALDVLDSLRLVWCFLEFERVFERLLPRRVHGICVARRRFSIGVERQKFFRHFTDGFLDARLPRLPDGRAQPVERRHGSAQRLVFLY